MKPATLIAIIWKLVGRFLSSSIHAVSLTVALFFALGAGAFGADTANPALHAAPESDPPFIVIGFLGGFVRHDAMAHSAVQVAAHLRKDYPSGVHAEVLENHRREEAHMQIRQMVDSDHNGTLSPEEKRNARIILYGHSWGASEAITLARELEKDGIPVLLTVQVDSVAKPGENDQIIPSNVVAAANFYQLDGFLHGQSKIRAADPARTQVLGNFRFDYKTNPIPCENYPWYDRLLMKPHIEIECDPRVWKQVESLIQARLPAQHSPAER